MLAHVLCCVVPSENIPLRSGQWKIGDHVCFHCLLRMSALLHVPHSESVPSTI